MTAQEALQRLIARCQVAEQCTADALRLMHRWQVPEQSQQSIIDHLIRHRYIDHQRYAQAFTHDKLHINRWGTQRIRHELQARHIEANIIDQALMQVDDTHILHTLRILLQQKEKTLKGKTPQEIDARLIRYAIGKGYSLAQIRQCIHIDCDD